MSFAFQWSLACRASSMSTRPTISSKLRKPICAMYCRTCSAMKKKKLTTFSGVPWNFARSAGSCVAMPTGQVLRWHLRIMMQPIATSGAVEKPNSSAPSSAAMVTSRPVCSLPSVCSADAPAQVVHHQHLVRFGQPQFPRRAGVLDGTERARARAAAIAGDQHHVGMRLGHARGHRPHADFGHQLHRNPRPRIDVLQIVDQLRQILDGVNIVVRRRRNQAHPGDRMPHPRDGLIHLVSGQLAALAGLGALRHLDLQLVGVDQVIRGDAEPRARHLLDRAAPLRAEARLVFSALARIALAADAVHRDGQRLVRFLRNRAVAHGAGGEPLDDLLRRLHLFQRNRFVRALDLEQSAQRAELPRLLVDQVGVFLEVWRSSPCAPRAAASLWSADCTGDTRRACGTGSCRPPPAPYRIPSAARTRAGA